MVGTKRGIHLKVSVLESLVSLILTVDMSTSGHILT